MTDSLTRPAEREPEPTQKIAVEAAAVTTL